MARYLDELKKLILDQTLKVGAPVANIYGVAAAPLAALTGVEESSWLVLAVPGRDFETVESFYLEYASEEGTNTRLITTTTGAVVWRHAGEDQVTILLRGTVDLANSRTVTIAVRAGDDQGEFKIQVDGVVKRAGTGGGQYTLLLDAGTHVIELLVGNNVAGVAVAQDLRVRGEFERVLAPTWKEVTTGYIDQAQGQAKVDLTWYSDVRAGGWRVLRRQLTVVSAITAVGAVDPNRDFTLTLTGDQTAVIVAGLELRAINELMGTVRSAVLDGSNTQVRLRLAPGRITSNTDWVGRNALRGNFVEVARIGRTSPTGEVTWRDTGVAAGQLYDYALQAWGFLDSNTWSALSNIQVINAGDSLAPGPITFVGGYPRVQNRRAYVRFTAPVQTDYSGVRVYYRNKFEGTATSGGASSITDSGANFTGVDTTFTVEILEGTGAGQVRAVASLTGTTQVNVTPDWSVNPDATSRYIVYKDQHLRTDYGLPNTADQFDFEPISTDPSSAAQLYSFRSFDLALNEQGHVESALWTYSPGTDGSWTSPPIVGIRQVPTTEQALFSAPYNNATNWAIIELSASDVLGRFGGITIYYQRRADGSPIALPASSAPATEGGTPRVLDIPAGTRSRYVEIDRTIDQNWIKVYALDADDNKSDTQMYSVDYDDRPEVAVADGRLDTFQTFVSSEWNTVPGNPYGTGVNLVQGIVIVTGAVDDDAQGFKYWIEDPTGSDPTFASPLHIDCRTVRSLHKGSQIGLAFTLGDGERKVFVVEPWSGFTGTEGSGGTVTGTAGEQSRTEFSRTPRSALNVESKDEGGNASGRRIKLLFELTPPAITQAGFPLTAHATTQTATTLKDNGSPSWTVDQWASINRVSYFVIASRATSRGGTWSSAGVTLNTTDATINDGDTATNSWHTDSAVAGAYVQVDMGAGNATRFTEARIYAAAASNAGVYKVRGSQDGAVWTDLATGFRPVQSGWNAFSFPLVVTAYRYWRLELTNTPGAGSWLNEAEFVLAEDQCRKIVGNTADTLTVTPAWVAQPFTSSYEIVDSAVLFRVDGSGTFKATAGIEFLDRKDGVASTIEYYAAKNKCPDEGVKRVVVDSDTIPSFTLPLSLTNPTTNTLRVTVAGPDDDVKFWRVYRRKDNWPTSAGAEPTTATEVRREYLHHEDQVGNLTYDSYADEGTHYIVIVPINALNQEGPILKGSYSIVGASDPRLSNLRVTHEDGGGTVNNRVKWDHADTSTHKIKIWGKRVVEATGIVDIAEQELTGVGGSAATRVVNLDSEFGDSTFTNANDTDMLANIGSWIHGDGVPAVNAIPTARATPTTGVAYKWVYRVELYDSVGTTEIGEGWVIEDSDYYLPSDMTIATATAVVNTFGGGAGSPATCHGVPSRRIQWTLAFPNDAAFTVKIEVATDAAGTGPFNVVASGLTPSDLQWYHFENGYYRLDPGGVARYWTYKVSSIRNSDGGTVNSVTTSPAPTLTYLTDTCTGGPF